MVVLGDFNSGDVSVDYPWNHNQTLSFGLSLLLRCSSIETSLIVAILQ